MSSGDSARIETVMQTEGGIIIWRPTARRGADSHPSWGAPVWEAFALLVPSAAFCSGGLFFWLQLSQGPSWSGLL